MKEVLFSLPFVVLTFLCWGVYGPVLHIGQEAMDHSRLRPFLCVGVAYFLIAVVVPIIVLAVWGEKGDWTFKGTFWSSAAGAAGAIGALGIILAFNVGGKPIYVMPLVFGFAPVVNTLFQISRGGLWSKISPMFLAGLILVAVGAATVLIWAPKGPAKPRPTASASPDDSMTGGSSGKKST